MKRSTSPVRFFFSGDKDKAKALVPEVRKYLGGLGSKNRNYLGTGEFSNRRMLLPDGTSLRLISTFGQLIAHIHCPSKKYELIDIPTYILERPMNWDTVITPALPNYLYDLEGNKILDSEGTHVTIPSSITGISGWGTWGSMSWLYYGLNPERPMFIEVGQVDGVTTGGNHGYFRNNEYITGNMVHIDKGYTIDGIGNLYYGSTATEDVYVINIRDKVPTSRLFLHSDIGNIGADSVSHVEVHAPTGIMAIVIDYNLSGTYYRRLLLGMINYSTNSVGLNIMQDTTEACSGIAINKDNVLFVMGKFVGISYIETVYAYTRFGEVIGTFDITRSGYDSVVGSSAGVFMTDKYLYQSNQHHGYFFRRALTMNKETGLVEAIGAPELMDTLKGSSKDADNSGIVMGTRPIISPVAITKAKSEFKDL